MPNSKKSNFDFSKIPESEKVLRHSSNIHGSTYREVKSFFFELTMGGQNLQDYHLDIRSISVKDTSNGANTLTITMVDTEYVLLNSSMLSEETAISFKGGIIGEPEVKFDGYVSLVGINFGDNGVPLLTINCMDKSHKMHRVKETKTWKKMSPSDIARAIFKKHGLAAVVDNAGKKEDTISQSNKTDIEFLRELAGKTEVPFLVDVTGKTGKFVKKDLKAKSTHTLVYKEFPFDIKSFSPRVDKTTKRDYVKKGKVNPKTKKTDKSKSGSDTPRDKQGDKTVNNSSKSSSSKSKTTYKYTKKGWVKK